MDGAVFDLVKNGTAGRLTIATRSSGLLVVGFKRAGKVVVDYKTDVRLVDPETERVGRDHRLDPIRHKCFLCLGALVAAAAAMVKRNRPALAKLFIQVFSLFDRCDIHDSRPFRRAKDPLERGCFLALVDGREHFQEQVWPDQLARQPEGTAHPQLMDYVVLNLRWCSGGEREDRRPTESLGNRAQHHVIRAKVMPPLGNAVGLIHHEKRDLTLQQDLEEVAIAETARG